METIGVPEFRLLNPGHQNPLPGVSGFLEKSGLDRANAGEMAERIDHDSPWKETLDRFLRPFLELTFPSITRHIDWAVAPISLEQEFREIAPDAELGPLRADKLIKVRLLNGTDEWLLIHIEVQMQYDPRFPDASSTTAAASTAGTRCLSCPW